MGLPIKRRSISVWCIILFFAGIHANETRAQQAQLYLELELSNSLVNSQVINISNLLSPRGNGPSLFTLYLQNENSSESARDLYFNIRLRSDKRGLIAHFYQKQGQPFSLRPGQRVHAKSNDLKNGLPGVKENIELDGGLTSEGEEFFNNLGGSTRLPPDRYVIQVDVFQGGNSRNGGVWLTSAEAELGSSFVEDVRDIYLTTPGNVLGSGVEITNPYPDFRWEGSRGTNYRLLVVEAKGQESPESLLQGALSTEPIKGNGNGGNGILLDYEMLDVSLKKTSYQYPPSGVQALKPGHIYYWQVLAELSTSNGVEMQASEIWSFTLAEQGDMQTLVVDGELQQVLRQFLNNGRMQQLQRNGFRLQSVVIDGEVVTGPMIMQRLKAIKDRLDQGEIVIQGN